METVTESLIGAARAALDALHSSTDRALKAEVAGAARLLALAVRDAHPTARFVHLTLSGDHYEATAWSEHGVIGFRHALDSDFNDYGARSRLYVEHAGYETGVWVLIPDRSAVLIPIEHVLGQVESPR